MKFYLVEFGAGVQVKRYERDMITKGSKFSDIYFSTENRKGIENFGRKTEKTRKDQLV